MYIYAFPDCDLGGGREWKLFLFLPLHFGTGLLLNRSTLERPKRELLVHQSLHSSWRGCFVGLWSRDKVLDGCSTQVPCGPPCVPLLALSSLCFRHGTSQLPGSEMTFVSNVTLAENSLSSLIIIQLIFQTAAREVIPQEGSLTPLGNSVFFGVDSHRVTSLLFTKHTKLQIYARPCE